MNDSLIEAALSAREHAYAPYSGFRVGAACIDTAGRIFTGANVENASYGLTVCAERIALWKARTEGAAPIERMAVVAETKSGPVHPCGACRQVMIELAPDAVLMMANTAGEVESRTVAELLPLSFSWDDTGSPRGATS